MESVCFARKATQRDYGIYTPSASRAGQTVVVFISLPRTRYPKSFCLGESADNGQTLGLTMGAYFFLPDFPRAANTGTYAEILERITRTPAFGKWLMGRPPRLALGWAAKNWAIQDNEELPLRHWLPFSDNQKYHGLERYPFLNSTLVMRPDCAIRINSGRTGFRISGPMLLRPSGGTPEAGVPVDGFDLYLNSPDVGVLEFDYALTESDLETFDVGLRYFWGDDGKVHSRRYPVFRPANQQKIRLRARLDPYDPEDKGHTAVVFRPDTSGTPQTLGSYFRTSSGHPVSLIPQSSPDGRTPRLLAAVRPGSRPGKNSLYLVPDGDFALRVDDDPAHERPPLLLCGLSGTETISIQPGREHPADVLSFHAGQPARAREFPFTETSPVGKPFDPARPLLDSAYTTAWLSLISASGNHYGSQPVGMSLYGKNGISRPQDPRMLGFVEMGKALPQARDFMFPMVPYAGVNSGTGPDTILAFESRILSATRHRLIAENRRLPSKRFSETTEPWQATTPQGMIVQISPDGGWSEIQLARSRAPDAGRFRFTGIAPQLQQAFQTNQLFLVATGNQYLGRLNPDGEVTGNAFHNRLTIAGWNFQINTGHRNRYGDYRNVLICKYCRGALTELVKNPAAWTQAEDFNIRNGARDPAELVVISGWLQRYLSVGIDEWRERNNPFYEKFARITTDPNWQGILGLRVDVTAFPDQLQGLLGGIEQERFFAHHIAIEANHIAVATGIEMDAESSMFGLIAYLNEAYEENLKVDPEAGDKPVAPTPDNDYDFKILGLHVRFENSRVRDYSSKAQLTMNRLFGDRVTGVGNQVDQFNSLILNGSYQNQNGQDIYVFDQTGDHRFTFDSNLLNGIDIVKAQFNTRRNQDQTGVAQPAENPMVRSWFSLWGFFDFKALPGLDVLSFGGDAGREQENQTGNRGLGFANLGIEMSFSLDRPTERGFRFDPRHVTFDLQQSKARPHSFYPNFALQLKGLATGSADQPPESLGYLPISTKISITGMAGEWYGLDCALNMGSPGALAGEVGLNAGLLIAWSPGGTADEERCRVFVGLKLPGAGGGAKLMSLQGVIKLAIDDLSLQYVEEQQSYLLILKDIALKFLGIAKLPPGGATAFYLFGNPKSGAKGSSLGWYAIYNKEPG